MIKRNFKIITAFFMLLFTFLSVQAQSPTPGGVNGGSYQFVAWLTPDGYSRSGNTGTWQNNFIGGASVGNFTTVTTTRNPTINNSWGYNFHPSVNFPKSGNSDASNRIRSASAFNLNGRNVTSFFVLKDGRTSNWYNSLITFHNGNKDLSGIAWWNNATKNIRYIADNSTIVLNNAEEGLLAFDYSNGGGSLVAWQNGAKETTTSGRVNLTYNDRITLSENGENQYGFIGDIQEVIIVSSGASNTFMSTSDRQKIHSYLAIKYGITLGTSAGINGGGDYVNSAGTSVWTKANNTGYLNCVFGIARDDNSRLNQVQSRSNDSDMLTLYKGTLNAQNNNNSLAFTLDKSHVMIGSNSLSVNNNVSYPQGLGTPFENVPGGISFKLNYHTSLIYKAQVTTNNGSGSQSQTVNIQLNSARPKYVIVSSSASFPSGTSSGTRIYPITNKKAENILLYNGDFITFAGFEPLPGGLSGFNLDMWVDGDHSTNTSWENLASSIYSLQKFSTNAPVVRNSRLNFHKEIYFGNATSSKLRTTANFNMAANESYFTFVVSENPGTSEHILLSYRPTTGDSDARRTSLQWYSANMRAVWNGTIITLSPANTQRFGIATMSIRSGAGSNTSSLSMNGGATTNFTAATQAQTAVPLIVGNGNNNTTTGSNLPFNGAIQEMILMRRNNTTAMTTSEIARVNSYLAIKYGITLTSGDYLDSNGNTVWSRSANAGYENNIFGIARDDESGLYQKQSKSTSFPYITMFINGSTLKTLNDENTGTLVNGQYFIAGSNGGSAIQSIPTPIDPDTPYENGSIRNDIIPLNIKSSTYKAQWTGFTGPGPITVSMQAHQDFYYAQVSIDANFTPGSGNNTKIYPVVDGFVNVEFSGAYQFFRFVGFSPGPGGVIPNLKLWLRADDEAALGTAGKPTSDSRLSGYSVIRGEDPDNIPTVQKWSDLVRGHDFIAAGARDPVLRPNAAEMNYYPAVLFWFTTNSGGTSVTNAAYMSNSAGNIVGDARPAEHSALFMVNNKFVTAQFNWVYTMLFSSSTTGGQYQGPGYGMNRTGTTDGRGRFRSNDSSDSDGNGAAIGVQNLFKPDATTILGYYPKVSSGNNVDVLFRFNAKEEKRSALYSNITDMRRGSQLGSGFDINRTINGVMSEAIIYDRELDAQEKINVESYLALKYGVTLYPSYNTATNRFDYTLSDGTTVIWNGNVSSGKFVDYYNNVAAILRDDAARLNNRHSHSTNVGSLLHLGIAGTELSDNANNVGYWENNMEAVAFGDDGNRGVTKNTAECGKFDWRFNRIWYIHKVTKNNRPISLLVGAQDNRNISLGSDSVTTVDYYSKLVSTNNIYLIVANSAQDIVNGNHVAVIPMNYVNGEYQCNYVFKENDTYITFGYSQNISGCYTPEEFRFGGSKTFRWSQYTSSTNRSNNGGLTITGTNPAGMVDLGDGIEVTSTKLVYPGNSVSGVKATRGYPRTNSSMGTGGLEVRRRSGAIGDEVIITIEFNKAVMPSFSISGIDDYRYTSYDEVTISGMCSGQTFYPQLSNANRTPSYTINGATATANKRSRLRGNNKNGMVNIEFQGAVEKVEIRYRLKNRVRGTQRIYISPITLRSSFPPPPINEDGLGFAKYAYETELTTCEPATYIFNIINTNCEDKYVHFIDELSPGMKWEIESLALDSINNFYNPKIDVNAYGGVTKLEIDSLIVPGASEIKFRATALFDEDAPSGEYKNRAHVTYDKNSGLAGEIFSVDRSSAEEETTIHVTWQERHEKVQIEVISKSTYMENSNFEITYKITNPNAGITDMFMDFDFNEDFSYVPSSLDYHLEDMGEPWPGTVPTLVTDNQEQNVVGLAGTNNASAGFTLPSGISYITFKIKTPVLLSIDDELDENNQPTGNKEPLLVSYSLFSMMEDPCMIAALQDLDGASNIPFSKIVKAVISNSNVSSKIKK